MRYLDLNILTAQHLFGSWNVLERPGSATDASVFATCTQVVFEVSGDLEVQNGSSQRGKWEIFKETEIIYNPQLNFTFKGQEEVLNAIITRYREDDEEGYVSRKVTLYFNSGLELVLEQKITNPA